MTPISSASLAAIRSLQSLTAQIDTTQNRISSGLRIASASDGASNWATAQGLRSDIKSYDQISDNIDYMQSAFDVAENGAQLIYDTVSQIRTLVSNYGSATWSTAEKAQAEADLGAYQAQLKSIIADSSFKNINMLNAVTTRQVLINFATDGSLVATPVNVTPQNLNGKLGAVTAALAAGKTFYTFTLADANTTGISGALGAIDTLLGQVTTDIAAFGGASKQLDSAAATIKSISDVKSAALGNLVDADMEEESARLSALQVKQQLAIQSLSIANNSGQNILRLFQ